MTLIVDKMDMHVQYMYECNWLTSRKHNDVTFA